MRKIIFALILISLLAAFPVFPTRNRGKFDVFVINGGWGTGRVQDIKAVLLSAGGELLQFFPEKDLGTILVFRSSEEFPRTLYEKGLGGEYQVLLSTQDTYWAQYTYQFSHELCHILSNYEKSIGSNNDWFEESLCETASMFTLRRMSATWRNNAPYPCWRDFAPHLKKYADNLQNKPARKLPPGKTFIEWFLDNQNALKQDHECGDMEKLIANRLLPLFEKDPSRWESVRYLSLGNPSSDNFKEFLNSWHKNTPEKHRKFIEEVAYLFGIRITQ